MYSSSFNRRGDSLGGATGINRRDRHTRARFQSQRRFFGGSNATVPSVAAPLVIVSIAEAILWGEQPILRQGQEVESVSFNRRGDSLGGATKGAGVKVYLFCSFNRRGDSLGGATAITPTE